MFSTIDSFSIICFQWTVRQIELYTPITRKVIIALHTIVTKGLFIFWIVLSVRFLRSHFFSFTHPLTSLLVAAYFGAVVGALVKDLLDAVKISKEDNPPGVLPKEIKSRKKIRHYLVVNWVVQLVLPYWVAPWVYLLAVQCAFLGLFCLEYLLCTTSLPPEEKERRKTEKDPYVSIPQYS